MKLLDELYCYIWQGMGNNCNTYLLAGEVPILIDPGHVRNELREPCLDILLTSMKSDGFSPENIGLVINTHLHPDHVEANRVFLDKGSVKLAYHEEEEKHAKKMLQMFRIQAPDFRPDFYLQEGELNLGIDKKITLEVIHTPGHSPGSVCLYWAEKKVLITGDLIFASSVGRTDFPGGSLQLLKQSIDKISELDIEYLLPGHMSIVKGKENVRRNFALVGQMFF